MADGNRIALSPSGRVVGGSTPLRTGQLTEVELIVVVTNRTGFTVELGSTLIFIAGEEATFREAVGAPPQVAREDKRITWGGPLLTLEDGASATITIRAAIIPMPCAPPGRQVPIIARIDVSGNARTAAGERIPLTPSQRPQITTEVINGLQSGCAPVAAGPAGLVLPAVVAPAAAPAAPPTATAPAAAPSAPQAAALPAAGTGLDADADASAAMPGLVLLGFAVMAGAALLRRRHRAHQ